jgi:hypothetical protein
MKNEDLIDKIGLFNLEESGNRLEVFFSFLHCLNFLSFCWIIFSLSFDFKIWFWGVEGGGVLLVSKIGFF